MGDSDDEFEPLFDYKRVQPLNFVSIEDDPDSPAKSPKRRKTDVKAAVEVIDCDENDEDDLLLSPSPMILGDAPKPGLEDSIIKELRKRREELASLAKSAEDVLKTADEPVKGEDGLSLQFSPEVKPVAERAKIVISIQDKEGQKQFRIYVDDKFERLFKMYSEKMKIDPQTLVFCFDGDKISPSSTPASLEMEDEDIIEVHIKSR